MGNSTSKQAALVPYKEGENELDNFVQVKLSTKTFRRDSDRLQQVLETTIKPKLTFQDSSVMEQNSSQISRDISFPETKLIKESFHVVVAEGTQQRISILETKVLQESPQAVITENIERIDTATASTVMEFSENVRADNSSEQDQSVEEDYGMLLTSGLTSKMSSGTCLKHLAFPVDPNIANEIYPDEECSNIYSVGTNEISKSGLTTTQSSMSVSLLLANKIDDDDYDDDNVIRADNDATNDIDDAELQPLDVLLQFIPYYSQGDPANDAIVRSALSGMPVDDIDSKDDYGNTLLLLASQYHCEDLVRIMLNKGANPSALNSAGACCLHFACYKESQSMNIAKVLLQCGANPEVVESTYGCTPLHYAAGSGNTGLCKLLLSYGAQVASLDFYNYTCIDYAKEAKMQETVAFLQHRLDQLSMQYSYRMMDRCMNLGGGGYNYNYDQNQNRANLQNNSNSHNNHNDNNLFLMQQLLQQYQQHQHRPPNGNISFNFQDWREEDDPASGEKYYLNYNTGESLWEIDFQQRIKNHNIHEQYNKIKNNKDIIINNKNHKNDSNSSNDHRDEHYDIGRQKIIEVNTSGIPEIVRENNIETVAHNGIDSHTLTKNSDSPLEMEMKEDVSSPNMDLGSPAGMVLGFQFSGSSNGGFRLPIRRASTLSSSPFIVSEKSSEMGALKNRLQILFGKYAENRMEEIDVLVKQYQGIEEDLLEELCIEYDIPLDQEISLYKSAIGECKVENMGRKKYSIGSRSPISTLIQRNSRSNNAGMNRSVDSGNDREHLNTQQNMRDIRESHDLQVVTMINDCR